MAAERRDSRFTRCPCEGERTSRVLNADTILTKPSWSSARVPQYIPDCMLNYFSALLLISCSVSLRFVIEQAPPVDQKAKSLPS